MRIKLDFVGSNRKESPFITNIRNSRSGIHRIQPNFGGNMPKNWGGRRRTDLDLENSQKKIKRKRKNPNHNNKIILIGYRNGGESIIMEC